jgi:hypothetical protein
MKNKTEISEGNGEDCFASANKDRVAMTIKTGCPRGALNKMGGAKGENHD